MSMEIKCVRNLSGQSRGPVINIKKPPCTSLRITNTTAHMQFATEIPIYSRNVYGFLSNYFSNVINHLLFWKKKQFVWYGDVWTRADGRTDCVAQRAFWRVIDWLRYRVFCKKKRKKKYNPQVSLFSSLFFVLQQSPRSVDSERKSTKLSFSLFGVSIIFFLKL